MTFANAYRPALGISIWGGGEGERIFFDKRMAVIAKTARRFGLDRGQKAFGAIPVIPRNAHFPLPRPPAEALITERE